MEKGGLSIYKVLGLSPSSPQKDIWGHGLAGLSKEYFLTEAGE
jgi:hypothetical protein